MSRQPLLLLPGMMCDARLFAPQISDLDDIAEIRVGDLGGAETISEIARQVLEAAPWPRFALAGLSMGGIVAMEVMRQAPERVERLALLDTNHRAEAPDRQALRQPQIERAVGGALRRVLIEEMKPLYLAPQSRDDETILNTVLDMALDLGAEVFVRQSTALRDRPDQSATLRAAEVPTLVLCGACDNLCPVERHLEIAALLPRARLEIIPEAGHLPTLERPAETSAALRRWLN
ncbi:alpha/beta fold hydrolase [Pelagibius sp.]|uniref:alpha/beta fold hydrolase n=1 Tax=Pelagibius sp. TaxID=1931238 RepID=UPI002611F52C|nr:alpha/beta fold hydrolase [Pelagibius sp.]